VAGRDLIVDLLVPASVRQKPFVPRRVAELGAHATALPFLSFLLEESCVALAIGKSRLVPVRVPDAARFCLHKMVVASLRPPVDGGKRMKDTTQAAALAAILAEEDPDRLIQVAQQMDEPFRARVCASLPRVLAELEPWPDACDLLEAAISCSPEPAPRGERGG
jgi:hypothetical protein